MRLIYHSWSKIPGRAANSVHVMKMCAAFARSGHRVVLLAPDLVEGREAAEDPFQFYGVEDSFEIRKLPWRRPLPAYQYSLRGIAFARKWKPDLTYGRNLYACYLSCRLGMPTIYEDHGPVANAGEGSLQWRLFRHLLKSRSLERVVVISEALREFYLERFPVDPDRILVAPDAADSPQVQDLQLPLLPGEGALKVGYVGHLYPGRGVEIILNLALACPWADFHLVGGTESDISFWRGQIGEQSNVFFHEFVRPAMGDAYRLAFDVAVTPYQRAVLSAGGGDTTRWMSPLKIFEYMAAGRPIISSDLPVLREVLEHERNALLCPPDDVAAWAAALERLRDEEGLRERLGENGRQDFLRNYTWTARAATVLTGLKIADVTGVIHTSSDL